MFIPLSWLKQYVDIIISPEKLAERLTEVGLNVEKIEKKENDTIFEFEITPNRPDWYSVIGIAREIAAIENKKIKLEIPNTPKATKKLPFTIHNNYALLERYVNVIIADVTIKESPMWLQDILYKIELRPINNVVDITNYVMFELGIPLHAFDYDEIKGHEFFVEKAKGGEKFTSVDKITYTLPKNAIIIKDKERVVDLVGIKGGLNSGIKKTTKNVLLQTSVDDPILIRRASQSLSLRSMASTILEKGIDKNGLIPALSRAANLIIQLTNGEIASQVTDLKKKDYTPWKRIMQLEKLTSLLGITIPQKKIIEILTALNLSPKIITSGIEVTIPTYRNDLQIEEDIIEEVARHYGYNNFPLLLPTGPIPAQPIPYIKDYRIEKKAKLMLIACGFSEIYTYSLISEADLALCHINSEFALRVDNPVSRDFEYLRPTLKINLIKALKQNLPYTTEVNLFELGKIYTGKDLKVAKEAYMLSGITNKKSFLQIKGLLEKLMQECGIAEDPTPYIMLENDYIFFELPWTKLLEKRSEQKIYKPIPKFPPIIEDLAFTFTEDAKIGDIIKTIKKQSNLIADVTLLDVYKNTKTFHIIYQHKERNLTANEVEPIRKSIIKDITKSFGAEEKE